jgi:GNAT superfamily N-acetyltransferase
MMEQRYADHLDQHLGRDLVAWIAEVEGSPAGSGVVAFLMWPPGPFNPADRIGHIHSLYTLPEARRRGVARAILASAIEYCSGRGLRWVTLQASDEGRSLYESFGFKAARDEMRLELPNRMEGS